MWKEAPQIASVGPFDLEHFRAKIRHDGRRGRTRNIRSAVDHPDSRQDSVLLHRQTPTDESEITYTSLVQRIEFGNIERPKKKCSGIFAGAPEGRVVEMLSSEAMEPRSRASFQSLFMLTDIPAPPSCWRLP